MSGVINKIKNLTSKLNLNNNFTNLWNAHIKNNRLLTTIIIANIVIYIMFTLINTFFKLPIVLFLGTVLGLWVYSKKIIT